MTRIAGRTRAYVAIGGGRANTIGARFICAKVHFAARARVRRRTQTLESVRIRLILTRAVVQAGGIVQITVVHTDLASSSIVADRANAEPIVGPVTACASLARIAQTIVDELVTVFARVAGIACARVICRGLHLAAHAHFAWRGQTRVYEAITVIACQLGWTTAYVARKVSGHCAVGTVGAWLT